MIDFDTFQKLPKNVADLERLIVAKDFKKLPKVQLIAQSGHTDQPSQKYFLGISCCHLHHSTVDLSAPTIRQSLARIPNTPNRSFNAFR